MPTINVTTDPEMQEYFMRQALQEAEIAYEMGEVPVGAVVECNGSVIARGHNLTQRLNDVTAHAEMQAITAAAEYLGGKYLTGCTLYVTVEPCIMCAGALGWSQISQIVYGASDAKRGYASYFCESQFTPTPLHPRTKVVSGVLEDECRSLMQQFFKAKRR
jgi:tRNA(adenine34) deaminase